MPSDSGMAFVIVQHLDPTHGSLMAELLGRCTAMPVRAGGGRHAGRGRSRLLHPPGKVPEHQRTDVAADRAGRDRQRTHADRLLPALPGGGRAGARRSGSSSPAPAPTARSACARSRRPADWRSRRTRRPPSTTACRAARSPPGAVDHVLSPGADARHPARVRAASACAGAGSLAGRQIEPRSSERRPARSCASGRSSTSAATSGARSSVASAAAWACRHVERVADYVRLLTDEPAEAAALFDDLLISVTSFFRDPEAWRVLQEQVIRPLVAAHGRPGRAARLGARLRDRRGGLLDRHAAHRGAAGREEELPHPDLRVGRRRGRARVRARRPLPGEHRRRRAAGAPAALLRRGGPLLSRRQRAARVGGVRAPEPAGGPTVLQARPDLLPQRPHVPRAGGPEARSSRCCTSRSSRTGTSSWGPPRRSASRRTCSRSSRRSGGSIGASGRRGTTGCSSRSSRTHRTRPGRSTRRRAARASAGSARSPSSCCSSASSRRAC